MLGIERTPAQLFELMATKSNEYWDFTESHKDLNFVGYPRYGSTCTHVLVWHHPGATVWFVTTFGFSGPLGSHARQNQLAAVTDAVETYGVMLGNVTFDGGT